MITFRLKTPKAKTSAIRAVVWSRGVNYIIATGVSVSPSEWNKKQQRVRQSAENLEKAVLDNEALNRVESALNRTIARFKEKRTPPEAEAFRKVFDIEYRGEPEEVVKIPLFTAYMKQYIEKYRETKSYNTTKAITTVYNRLKEFERARRRKITFEGVDMTLYVELSTYFAKGGYRESYFAATIKVIKQVFREARDVEKIHSFDGIDSKNFTSSCGEVDNIYLTEEELERIYNLDISLDLLRPHYPTSRESDLKRKIESLSTARAYFLIGAYTGLRVSDLRRLGSANISDDRIRIRTRKTDKEVVIPMSPIVEDMLASGIDLSKPPTSQKINDALKELARLSGITEKIEITRRIGRVSTTETKERWQLVCMHTARRSFATNAHKAGVPTIEAMRMTGHTKESTFLKYIKTSAEETADILSNHPFFTKKKQKTDPKTDP